MTNPNKPDTNKNERKGIAKKCYNYALRALVRKDHTEKQMIDKLVRKYSKIHNNMVEHRLEKEQQQDAFSGLEFLLNSSDNVNTTASTTINTPVSLTNVNANANSSHDDVARNDVARDDVARNDVDDDAYAIDEGAMMEVVDSIIVELKERGYIDDQRYAYEFIRTQSKKYGEHRIRQGLKAKGIVPDDQMFDDVIGEATNVASPTDVATNLAQKYIARNRRKPMAKLRAGLYNHLMYRGFASDIASSVTATTIEAETEA